ncbi:uncharacterized protein LOC108912645 [Anoplophora glabripennis]|uniref:uncharacterized protein LOC108912645 n=1 Tax=Anoplophora glabripennis TaxID=217634 RepID=UPI000875A38B|nr:uncharacterized protein LOC108912645 [Anoplophora glabripennis]
MNSSKALGRVMLRQIVGKRNAHDAHAPVQSTYNDLPQPQGSWKTQYDANQRKYMAHLAIGIGAFVGTLIFGKAAGLLETYSDIPQRPAVIDSYQ